MIERLINWLRPCYPAIKILEVLGVLAALIAFSYDFVVEKPRERAVANATMLAQMASLDLNDPNDRQANTGMLRTLVDGGVEIKGVSLPNLEFDGVELSKAQFVNSSFPDATFTDTTFTDLYSVSTALNGATFRFVDFDGGGFHGPNFKLFEKPHDPKAMAEDFESLRNPREAISWPTGLAEAFRETVFYGSDFRKFAFTGVDLTAAKFLDSTFDMTLIQSSVLAHTVFSSFPSPAPEYWDLTIEKSLLLGVDFSRVTIENMNYIKFRNCIFDNVKFPVGYKLPEGAGMVLHTKDSQ